MAGMENITGVSLVPLTTSRYLSPLRMEFRQAGRARKWDLMRCHDSVAIVIFNTTEQRFVLVRQFRPAVYISVAGKRLGCELGPGSKVDTATVPPSVGFTLELCAGIVDKPRLSLVEVAREEVEECGYRVPADRLTKIIRDSHRYHYCQPLFELIRVLILNLVSALSRGSMTEIGILPGEPFFEVRNYPNFFKCRSFFEVQDLREFRSVEPPGRHRPLIVILVWSSL